MRKATAFYRCKTIVFKGATQRLSLCITYPSSWPPVSVVVSLCLLCLGSLRDANVAGLWGDVLPQYNITRNVLGLLEAHQSCGSNTWGNHHTCGWKCKQKRIMVVSNVSRFVIIYIKVIECPSSSFWVVPIVLVLIMRLLDWKVCRRFHLRHPLHQRKWRP